MSLQGFQSRTAHPPRARPMLLWDETCGFCRLSAARIALEVGDRVEVVPYQQAASRVPDIPPEDFARAVHLVEPDGSVSAGAEAIFRALDQGGRPAGRWCYDHVPGFGRTSEALYRRVAAHRPWVMRLVRHLVGTDLRPPQYGLVRWIFLRLLGLTALCAFVSLAVQWQGLVGKDGILPVADLMRRAHEVAQTEGWSALRCVLHLPTLAWLGASNGWLETLVGLGIVLSLLLVVDVAPGWSIAGLWVVYLSLINVGGVFLAYQWDALLLESLLVALFVAPWRLWPRLRSDNEPCRVGVWLVRLLVFKLMFSSGALKLISHDGTWTTLTALDYHFFTQPIPTWTAYYVAHLPRVLLAAATLGALVIETALPLFVLGPRRLRLLFGISTIGLMLIIGLTGNYGFFNLNTVALAMLLFDDAALRRLLPQRLGQWLADFSVPPEAPRRARRWIAWGLAMPLLLLSALHFAAPFADGKPLGASLLDAVAPFRSVNSYGLFRHMTRTRHEIVLEGSRDGVHWKPYAFRYKVGALSARPRFAGPHMPRLDWQMWFAALAGHCGRAPWTLDLQRRLLEGKRAVIDLLATDPFGGTPPRYLKSTLYDYAFTPLGDKAWWRRVPLRPFCPALTLEQGHLARARPN